MGLIHSSSTRLLDRTVCVQRRLVRDDGMGGTYQDWQAIHQDYWVRIYPDHHQPRTPRELGETADNPTHRAVGQPSINGRSIMVGDRFYDTRNNETYDIVGVIRPPYQLPYGAMHQFVCRIVKDDGLAYGQCGATLGSSGSAPGTATAPGTSDEMVTPEEAGSPPGGETHLLLRHFEIVDLDNIDAGTVDYGPYDGFVYGHLQVRDAVVAQLAAEGRRAFRYFEIMTFPPSTYHDAWFDWWRSQVQVSWDAGLESPLGAPGVFRLTEAGCQDQQFVDWSLLDAAKRQIIADKMFELSDTAGTTDSIFLDQAWVMESPYFFFSEPGSGGACGACAYCATYASIPAVKWPLWQASIMAFYALMDEMCAARGGWCLKNGEHRTLGTPPQQAPRPIFYENSVTNNLEADPKFANSVIGWKQHARNVLSIDVPDATYLPLMLDEFDARGGWVSFTVAGGFAASSAAVQSAYAQAAAVKAAH